MLELRVAHIRAGAHIQRPQPHEKLRALNRQVTETVSSSEAWRGMALAAVAHSSGILPAALRSGPQALPSSGLIKRAERSQFAFFFALRSSSQPLFWVSHSFSQAARGSFSQPAHLHESILFALLMSLLLLAFVFGAVGAAARVTRRPKPDGMGTQAVSELVSAEQKASRVPRGGVGVAHYCHEVGPLHSSDPQ